jgi:hypothetical protein
MPDVRSVGRPSVAPEIRFHAKVHRRGPDECWPWTGATNGAHGSFRIRAGVAVGAHRYAKELADGPCPPGKQAIHTCNTPDTDLCCNPAHIAYLPAGTNRTYRYGERNPRARLTDEQVAAIRRRALAGEPHRSLAAEYGCAVQYVSHIKRGWSRTRTGTRPGTS